MFRLFSRRSCYSRLFVIFLYKALFILCHVIWKVGSSAVLCKADKIASALAYCIRYDLSLIYLFYSCFLWIYVGGKYYHSIIINADKRTFIHSQIEIISLALSYTTVIYCIYFFFYLINHSTTTKFIDCLQTFSSS